MQRILYVATIAAVNTPWLFVPDTPRREVYLACVSLAQAAKMADMLHSDGECVVEVKFVERVFVVGEGD